MNKYFGTDGFRGEAGVTLTADAAFKTGRYLGYYLKNKMDKKDAKPKVAIGKDTRLSSYMLEYSIAAGLAASGADVYLLHVTTTPSVSYITLTDGFDLGIMITASHNPYYDNGIKIIDSHGEKLKDDVTLLIEDYIDGKSGEIPFASGARIGKIHDHYSGRNRYLGYLISLASNSYKGIKVGLDSANGAAFAISRSVFTALGAEVYSVGDEPNGLNVNEDCGSTHPERLCELVKKKGLDLGFAFDGDADRCIAVDKDGRIVNGDRIIYLLAKRLKRLGMLYNDTVVTTVMSNGGFIKSASDIGIKVETTRVGDRFVFEKMQELGAMLGGEESGHVIIKKYATTGDGILSAIMITEEMCDTKSTLRELTEAVCDYPQISASIRVKNKALAILDKEVLALKERIEGDLLPDGRLLLRESGTEPKIRVMVEAKDIAVCKKYVNEISELLKKRGHAIE